MSRYVSLINWTDQGAAEVRGKLVFGEAGAEHIDGTVDRAEAAQKLVADMGGSMQIYWTLGQYDMVAVSEFPDDETAVAFLAQLTWGGSVRTQTMRAFDGDGVRGIMSSKM